MNASNNRLAGLKAKPKGNIQEDIKTADQVGEERGFVDRSIQKKPDRKPSPRTFQLHPKFFPEIGEAIALEAEQMGITQGQLVEMMWQDYCIGRKNNWSTIPILTGELYREG